MNVVDLHPEELLDKELTGALSADERTRLDAHLAVCAACRFERIARDDFRVALDAESQGPRADAPPPKRVASPRTRVAVLLAAAVLVVSGIAGAGWSGVRHLFAVSAPAVVEVASVVETSSAPPPRPIAPRATVAPPPAPEPTASASAEAPAVTTPPVAHAPAPVQSAAPPPRERTASSVFADANLALRRGEYAQAIALYDEVETTFAGSAEATTTEAILGRLALDRGDAAGALRHFDAYLARGGGGLREEAMVGRATALGRLGRTGEEKVAWTALLAAYPSSAHAAHARARLEASGGR